MYPLLRNVRLLIFPLGLLLLAAAAVQPWARVPASFWPLLRVYTWIILGGGVLLAWGFQRGRVAYGLAALGLAAEGLRLIPGSNTTAIHLLAVLLPLNLAAIACLGERGVLSLGGLGRLTALAAQATIVGMLCFPPLPQLTAALEREFFNLPSSVQGALPQSAAVAYGAAAAVLLLQFFRRPRPIEAGFLGALGGAFWAMQAGSPRYELPLLAAAETALVLGLLLNSHAMAYRDELTGLPSRRALNELLPQLGRQFAVAMVDVDHFKKFNDRYGHEAGDQVLRMIASRLERIQGAGRVFRYGGEEFTIVFPGKDVEESVDHLEYVRKTIESGEFTVRGPQRPRRSRDGRRGRGHASRRGQARVRVTVSMGVAEPSARAADPVSVIRAADRALYRAKKAGRNQICD